MFESSYFKVEMRILSFAIGLLILLIDLLSIRIDLLSLEFV